MCVRVFTLRLVASGWCSMLSSRCRCDGSWFQSCTADDSGQTTSHQPQWPLALISRSTKVNLSSLYCLSHGGSAFEGIDSFTQPSPVYIMKQTDLRRSLQHASASSLSSHVEHDVWGVWAEFNLNLHFMKWKKQLPQCILKTYAQTRELQNSQTMGVYMDHYVVS